MRHTTDVPMFVVNPRSEDLKQDIRKYFTKRELDGGMRGHKFIVCPNEGNAVAWPPGFKGALKNDKDAV